MSFNETNTEWLSLIEISGPFLAVPVLKEVFPQGLEQLEANKRKRLRQAYEEWRDALENDDPHFPELHQAWIDEVLARGLELDEDGRGDVLKRSSAIPDELIVDLPEYGVKLAPDAAVIDEQSRKALMLIQTFPVHTDLEATSKGDGWATSPAERMVNLCRKTGCRLGLLTNGERWMLVDAPVGAVTTFASWYARLWGQEPVTLQAFVHLLGIRRFFVDESERLPALFDRSLKHQDEVTDALGEQVRRAVEVLIQALDKADLDRERTLLANVSTAEIYEAALTVMMRLVFLLSAEERGLLLLGDERYEAHYALSTLRMQLRSDSAEILERRWDAWSRLLALFRAVYGGIEHENLRMPALGGSLFDPDRFPFLEGRDKHSQWRTDPAKPLPIDNRTVLLLLDAIQQFQGRTLSYRALDVEQIGYVYEGLLERTVKRAKDVTLELDATKHAKTPWVTLTELELARKAGDEKLADLLRERSGSSASRIRNDRAKVVDDVMADKLLTACHADVALRDRVKPYANLLRVDPWGYPLVYPTGSFMVTTGSDRRETGTHYTPKSLTEAIVTETLTPVVYVGPAEGEPREAWQLKSAAELLDLKICDPAMGSGAFLVQVCRWLAERLVEAWSQAESSGKYVTVDGEVRDAVTGEEPLPRDDEERIVIARRLIAERCLYGVDLNPLAVELAKLSIWLVTLAKGRPFGFLDHNLRCGDSLLGIHRLDQLTELSMTPGQKNTQMRIFGRNIEQAVAEAIELRKRLRQMPIRDIHDVEKMALLNEEARKTVQLTEWIGDAFIGELFSAGNINSVLMNTIDALAIHTEQAINGDDNAIKLIRAKFLAVSSNSFLSNDLVLKPFHWPLEFPEVFLRINQGFDAIIGNPPFMRGTRIQTNLSELYLRFLLNTTDKINGNADLSAHFFRLAFKLLRKKGAFGLIATNTISQGDTRISGIQEIINNGGDVYCAIDSLQWPGSASVVVSIVHFYFGDWLGKKSLNYSETDNIDSHLSSNIIQLYPFPLSSSWCNYHNGSFLNGTGFVIDPQEALHLLEDGKYSKIVRPYIGGKELYSKYDPETPDRYVIYFGKMTYEDAAKWPKALSIVKERVYPERQNHDNKTLREKWWQFKRPTPDLYSECKIRSHVIAKTQVSSTFAFYMLPASYIFDQRLIIFTDDGYDTFAVLQSILHEKWAERYAATLKNDMSYTPRDCFENFPFPLERGGNLTEIGMKFHAIRSSYMRKNEIGLTILHKALNSPASLESEIKDLRNLLCELDKTVACAYGWNDLDISRTFVETSLGWKYSISESVKCEILHRLTDLNHHIYKNQQHEVNHEKTIKTKKIRKNMKNNESVDTNDMQTSLFDEHSR